MQDHNAGLLPFDDLSDTFTVIGVVWQDQLFWQAGAAIL
jgi:hypothetical protein